MTTKNTISKIREEYERITNGFRTSPLSDRQWLRICQKLQISDKATGRELLQALKTIRIYANLRVANGNGLVTLEDVRRYEGLEILAQQFNCTCTGRMLLESARMLQPSPSEATFRRWGEQLGIPFRLNRWYTARESQAYLKRLIRQTRFKFPNDSLRKVS